MDEPCWGCEDAKTNPCTAKRGPFDCKGCAVRALANSQAFRDCLKQQTLTAEYRDALERTFGSAWRAYHEQIKAHAERLKA